MGKMHPFPQHFEALSTTPCTGEVEAPWWVFPSQLPAASAFEEPKDEEAGKEHLASLVNSVCEEVKYRGKLLASVHAIPPESGVGAVLGG